LSEHKNLGDFGFLVGGRQNGTKKLLSKCWQVLTSLFFEEGAGGFRVLQLWNTRWFQVFETKIRATIEPLGSGYLKKLWNQRIIWV
jgi:hypothetical protein